MQKRSLSKKHPSEAATRKAGNRASARTEMTTNRPKTETSVAAVCVLGNPRIADPENKARISLLEEVVDNVIDANWSSLHCVLFPGGYFYLNEHVGHFSHTDRVQALEEQFFSEALEEAAHRLGKAYPGILIVAGVDSVDDTIRDDDIADPFDQLCVAWDDTGVVGIGRKVFPTEHEGRGDYVCYSEDFRTPSRVVGLASGVNALLCSCYDMFGIKSVPDRHVKQTGCIRTIDKDGVLYSGEKGQERKDFIDLRKSCIDDWHSMIRAHEISVGLTAIHYDPSSYWERHGIVTCSAALNGGLAVGAAHFTKKLPSKPDVTTLAAAKIPEHYLEMGGNRPHKTLKPVAHFQTSQVMVRLFAG